MLQIISGKFFTGQDRHIFDGKGITYANYSWVAPIETCIATLEPVGVFLPGVCPYVILYRNQIEKEDEQGRQATLIRTGDAEIVRQFECIATFGLKCVFGGDRWEVELACRSQAKDMSDGFVPQQYVPRFFASSNRGRPDEVQGFVRLVEKIIGLPRQKYLALITTLDTLRHALLVLSHNVNMGYSLLVYCLESLSQQFDTYEPVWKDYDDGIRARLDTLLSTIEAEKAQQIRSTLLQAGHLRLQKRFTEFVASHVSDDFYTAEAKGRQQATRPCELTRALRNTYQVRSKYVHTLEPLPDYLRMLRLPDSDLFRWDNEPYFTVSGLLRVVHHAIRQFIERGEYLKQETHNWRSDLPGIITLKLAPKYWIWKTEAFQPETAQARLSGFLSMYQEFLTEKTPVADLNSLLHEYEHLLPSTKKEHRIAMLALYVLFNRLAPPANRSPRYEEVLKEHWRIMEECSIETLIVRALTEEGLPWPVEQCAAAVERFRQGRFAKRALVVPVHLEMALMAAIANECLESGNLGAYDTWSRLAYLEAAGLDAVQDHIGKRASEKSPFDHRWIASGGSGTSNEADSQEIGEPTG
ncbi:MAG: hypothetical protein GXY83_04005 [Rhodopirellula sp.]|nr:hypothetical protein [Rhodopirellula sp.]